MSNDLEPSLSTDMSVDRGPAQEYEAYNEAAFWHFMGIECSRAERSGRSLLLLLVEFGTGSQANSGIAPRLASRLFPALTVCLREIDFIGWYRAGQVIGAVLTQGGYAPSTLTSDRIVDRVAELLGAQLPQRLRRRLRVRVVQLRSNIRD